MYFNASFFFIFCLFMPDFAIFSPSFVSSAVSPCHSFGCRTLTCQPWGVVRCSLSSRTASSLTHKNTQMMLAAHPGIEPGTTPSVVGGALLAILTDRQQLKTKILRL